MADAVSDRTLSDLITGKQRASFPVGVARAAYGQGMGMGWGDEAEAWLRSKLGQGRYEDLLKQIRAEQAQFGKDYPITSGAAELMGGVTPGVAMMMLPGGQAAGAAQVGRSTLGTIARMSALGAGTGAISGAGSAEEGQRVGGAAAGTVLGGALGVATPLVIRGATSGGRWLRDKLAPSAERARERAADKMSRALSEAGLTPRDIPGRMQRDVQQGVPSVVANVDPALVDLAETVAQRSGRGARKVEDALTRQKQGSRERVYQRAQRELGGGNYYADEAALVKDLRSRADDVYEAAYAHGDVDDPRIVEALKNPQFQAFWNRARAIADTEAQAAKLRGEDPSKFALPELYKPSGKFDANGNEILELARLPDVRTLDYIKRGLDATIDLGFRGSSLSKAEASALRDLRNQFVNAIDENVPAYRAARQSYAGDMEVIDAMRTGFNEFNSLDHEQIASMVAKMGPAEKEAFRTGVIRNIYGSIMSPSQNINAAQRLIGSPEMQAKLQPLVDNPGQFRLFQAALEREAQLFGQANRVLAGSQTGKRRELQAAFEADEEGGGVVGAAVKGALGDFKGALGTIVSRVLGSNRFNEETANRLADMLMSREPTEVAAVVRFLEQRAASAVPAARAATATEAGAVTGLTSSAWPDPTLQGAPADIEAPGAESGIVEQMIQSGPSIDEPLR